MSEESIVSNHFMDNQIGVAALMELNEQIVSHEEAKRKSLSSWFQQLWNLGQPAAVSGSDQPDEKPGGRYRLQEVR